MANMNGNIQRLVSDKGFGFVQAADGPRAEHVRVA